MKTLTQCKIKTSLILAIVATSAYSSVLLAQDMNADTPVERMSYHDNTVSFVIKSPGYTLLGGNYVTSGQIITSGQDPDNKNRPPQTYDVAGYDGSVTFDVGRKGSEKVANWFSNQVGANNNTFGHDPSKLNFAFSGTLTLSIQGPGLKPDIPVILEQIFLAQGHSGASNNWWFGGIACTRVAVADQVNCRSANYPTMTFSFVRGKGQHGFNAVDEVDVYITP